MRRRIIVVLVPVLCLLVLGVGISYAVLVGDRATQRTYVDRMGDAARFAAMVSTAVQTGDTSRMELELDAYTELYDSPVWVLGLEGDLLHDPGAPLPVDPAFDLTLERAFAGDRSAEAVIVWPWDSTPMYAIEPVGRDTQVTAVVIIEASTDQLRSATLRSWAGGAALILLPVGGLVAGLWPMTRWILRPVRELEQAAATVRSGDLDARADVEHGPSELRELAAAFNAMVRTVQSTMSRQRAFVEDAAHQLRNPLASLQLAVENLRPDLQDDEAIQAHDEAVEESERMAAMFEAMLSATAMTAQVPISDAETAPLNEVLEAGAPRWSEVLDAAGMTLSIDPAEPEWVLRQPAGGLAGVIDELISNAARLSGGSHVRLEVEREPDGRQGRIVVADNGIGLDPAERDSASGRFWRAPRHQNIPGTGLGLAILGELVGDVGGQLLLEANEPRGLRVVVRLPVIKV